MNRFSMARIVRAKKRNARVGNSIACERFASFTDSDTMEGVQVLIQKHHGGCGAWNIYTNAYR